MKSDTGAWNEKFAWEKTRTHAPGTELVAIVAVSLMLTHLEAKDL